MVMTCRTTLRPVALCLLFLLCLDKAWLARASDNVVEGYLGPLTNTAIAGESVGLVANQDVEFCASACSRHSACQAFVMDETSCHLKGKLRREAGDLYQFSLGSTLYERIDEPTHASCAQCQLDGTIHFADRLLADCPWTPTIPSDNECTLQATRYGYEGKCGMGVGRLESPWLSSYQLAQTACTLTVVFSSTNDLNCTELSKALTVSARFPNGTVLPWVANEAHTLGGQRCSMAVPLGHYADRFQALIDVDFADDRLSEFLLQLAVFSWCGERHLVAQCPADPVVLTLPTCSSTVPAQLPVVSATHVEQALGSCSAIDNTVCSSSILNDSELRQGNYSVRIVCSDQFAVAACTYDVFVQNPATPCPLTSTSTTTVAATTVTATPEASSTAQFPPSPPSTDAPARTCDQCTSREYCYQDRCHPVCPIGTSHDDTTRTCRPDPLPPRNVLARRITDTSFEVLFDPPRPKGAIVGYTVVYTAYASTGTSHSELLDYSVRPIPTDFSEAGSFRTYRAVVSPRITATAWYVYVQSYDGHKFSGQSSPGSLVFMSGYNPTTRAPGPGPAPSSPGHHTHDDDDDDDGNGWPGSSVTSSPTPSNQRSRAFAIAGGVMAGLVSMIIMLACLVRNRGRMMALPLRSLNVERALLGAANVLPQRSETRTLISMAESDTESEEGEGWSPEALNLLVQRMDKQTTVLIGQGLQQREDDDDDEADNGGENETAATAGPANPGEAALTATLQSASAGTDTEARVASPPHSNEGLEQPPSLAATEGVEPAPVRHTHPPLHARPAWSAHASEAAADDSAAATALTADASAHPVNFDLFEEDE